MGEQKEKEVNDFPTRKEWGKVIFSYGYIFILLVIIVTAGYRIYHISDSKDSSATTQNEKKKTTSPDSTKDGSTQNETVKVTEQKKAASTEEKKEKAKSLTELILVPMLESKKMQIIFEHLFYAFLLFISVLLIPIPFDRMKRLKLMNFEVELDAKGQEIVSNLSVQQDKFHFLTYWLREENKKAFMIKERNNDNFKDFVTEILEQMKEHYRVNWNIYFELKVLTEAEFKSSRFTIPHIVRKSLDAAEESFIGLPINKENESNVHFKNFLLYSVTETENLYTDDEEIVKYVIVLSSYRSTFDEYDGQLVSGLCSLTSELYRRFHLLKVVQQEIAN